MTPREKAEELFKKFADHANGIQWFNEDGSIKHESYNTKHCALIAINEIINATTKIWGGYNPETGLEIRHTKVDPYWQEVKKEIEIL
jgi:hypothetical protein